MSIFLTLLLRLDSTYVKITETYINVGHWSSIIRLLMTNLISFYNLYFLLEDEVVAILKYFQITFGTYLNEIIITIRSSNKEFKIICEVLSIRKIHLNIYVICKHQISCINLQPPPSRKSLEQSTLLLVLSQKKTYYVKKKITPIELVNNKSTPLY